MEEIRLVTSAPSPSADFPAPQPETRLPCPQPQAGGILNAPTTGRFGVSNCPKLAVEG